jgi:O-antigen/teichoic acid export membrane protein
VTAGVAAVILAGIILMSRLDTAAALVTAGIALAKLVESISDAFYGLLQKHERMDRIAKSLMLRGTLSLAVFAVALYFGHDVFRGVLAMVAVWLGVLVWYDLRSAKHVLSVSLHPAWNLPKMRALALMAAPLGIVMMLNSLNVNIPRYALEHFSGTGYVGIFAALAYLQVAEGVIMNALGQSATPRLARGMADGEYGAFWSLMKRLFALGSVGGVVGVAIATTAGPTLLTLLYKSEYAIYSSTFVWLMAGTVFANLSAFAGYGLTATRAYRSQIPLLIGESLVLSATCIVLIPKTGLLGAAIAYLAAKVFLTICSFTLLIWTTRRRQRRHQRLLFASYEN